jgi:hypothetical protein
MVSFSLDERRVDVLGAVGLLCWGLLCLTETGWHRMAAAAMLVAIGVFGALGKMSVFFSASLSVGAVGCALMQQGKWRLGCAVILGFGAGFVVGWVLCAQHLASLPAFFVNGWAISNGYNLAMAFETPRPLIISAVFVLAYAAASVIARCRGAPAGSARKAWAFRLLLMGWLIGLLFLSWKHGMVRGDAFRHPKIFFCFAPLLVIAVECLRTESRTARAWARGAAIACCVVSVFNVQGLLPCGYIETFRFQVIPTVWLNVRSLLGRSQFWAGIRMQEKQAAQTGRLNELPGIIGTNRVDVFGNYSIYALASHLNYTPRPVFQSYAAYSARLMRLNEDFYFSTNAPQYVLFSLRAIDERFPSLEDARVLRHLLSAYDLVAGEGQFLLFQSNGRKPAEPTLLHEGTVLPGERIDLERYGETNLWMEISLKPTLAGRIRSFLFKPPIVGLDLWRGTLPAQSKVFQGPPPMMSAGFVASPVLLTKADVQKFCTKGIGIRPAGYSVAVERGTEYFWEKRIPYRIYTWAKKDGS